MPGPTGDGAAPISSGWAEILVQTADSMRFFLNRSDRSKLVSTVPLRNLLARLGQLRTYAEHARDHPGHVKNTYGQVGDVVAGVYLACESLKECGAAGNDFDELYEMSKEMYQLFKG